MPCLRNSKTVNKAAKSDGIPKDRGWAWVIVAASAGLFCLIAGTFKCTGILKLEMENNFKDCNEKTTLWVLSASSIVSLLAGPPFGWLVIRTSHRVVGMVGGFICSIGLLLTAISPNCYFFFFSYSVVYSLGTGGVMVVVFSAFSDYFSKHRGLAVGLMASGSGLGGLVIPKLLRYLFETYEFREALICYAGVFLQTIVLAALLRPSSYYKKQESTTSVNESMTTSNTTSPAEEGDQEENKLIKHETLTPDIRVKSQSLSSIEKSNRLLSAESEHQADRLSIQNENNNKLLLEPPVEEFVKMYGSSYSLFSAPFASTLSVHSADNTNKQPTTTTISLTTRVSSPQPTSKTARYNWKLWYEKQVILIGLVVLFAVSSVNLVFQTTPSLAVEYGVDVDTVATIMTIAGSAEIVFRVFHGWFADRRVCSAVTQICAITLACTAGSILCSLLHSLTGIAIMYGVMSLCGTTIFSLLPIVIIEQVGAASLETVLGICYVYQAAAFIVSTLVANHLHTTFESWITVFYYIGASYFTATLVAVFTYFYSKLSRKTTVNLTNT